MGKSDIANQYRFNLKIIRSLQNNINEGKFSHKKH